MQAEYTNRSCLLPLTPPIFADTPASLLAGFEETRAELENAVKSVISNVDLEHASFGNVVAPLALADASLIICCQRTRLLEAASGDESIRAAARKVHLETLKMYEKFHSRRDLLERVHVVYQTMHNAGLNEEAQRLTEKWHHAFLNEGSHLDDTDRKTLTDINEHLRSNRSAFRKVLGEAKDCILLSSDQLAGLSNSVLDSLEQEIEEASGISRYRLSLKSSMVKTALAQIRDGSVRKAIFEASEKSVADALPFFMEVLRGRHQKANLLGSKSWAERAIFERMMRNPEAVHSFLGELQSKLTPLAEAELENLKKLKKRHFAPSGNRDESSKGFYIWDTPYFHEQHLQQSYQLDSHMLSEYFPVEPVLRNMLTTFEEMFSVSFEEVSDTTARALVDDPRTLVWHEDVKMFLVWETNARDKNIFIGYLYADLFARTGKYSTCANFSIHPGFTDANGNRHPSATALLTNFPPPTPNKPTLLQHSNVIQMFHELGHAMHDLLSRTRYAALHGHEVPRDFVELPSHMLENWCWVPDQLASISTHYSHISPGYAAVWKREHETEDLPPKTLPDELTGRLAASRTADVALSTLRQIVYAKFDMVIHGEPVHSEEELKRWWREERENIGLVSVSEAARANTDLGHGFATTVHFIEGSAASYYSHLL